MGVPVPAVPVRPDHHYGQRGAYEIRVGDELCAIHDRDVDAAINILAQGRWECGAQVTQVRPAAMPAQREEAGIHSAAAHCFARRGENHRPLGQRERQGPNNHRQVPV